MCDCFLARYVSNRDTLELARGAVDKSSLAPKRMVILHPLPTRLIWPGRGKPLCGRGCGNGKRAGEALAHKNAEVVGAMISYIMRLHAPCDFEDQHVNTAESTTRKYITLGYAADLNTPG